MFIDCNKLKIAMARAEKGARDLRDEISPTTLLRIRNGQAVGTKTAGKLARILNVDILEILETGCN